MQQRMANIACLMHSIMVCEAVWSKNNHEWWFCKLIFNFQGRWLAISMYFIAKFAALVQDDWKEKERPSGTPNAAHLLIKHYQNTTETKWINTFVCWCSPPRPRWQVGRMLITEAILILIHPASNPLAGEAPYATHSISGVDGKL